MLANKTAKRQEAVHEHRRPPTNASRAAHPGWRATGATLLARYGDSIPREHRRVLRSLADCGTARLGRVSYRCAQCEATHHTAASCGNRHCPGCQTANNGEWCAAQVEKLLPCEYHLVTFTIPSELRPFVRSHQRACYGALFDAAAHALRTALGNPRLCGAQTLGFTAVLHTFGRDLTYHPHVHVVIPGGGLVNADGATRRAGSHRPDQHSRSAGGNRPYGWRATRPGFLAPVKVLSNLFRAEFERLLRSQLSEDVLPPADEFRREFVCDVQAVGDGVSTLKYLSRYVFRTAITNNRIVGLHPGATGRSHEACSERSFDPQATALPHQSANQRATRTPAACGQTATVTFTYRSGGEHHHGKPRERRMALPVLEFLRRFLQHVLPRGLHKVRHYGFLSRRSQIELENVRAAILDAGCVADADVELQLVPAPWQRPSLSRPASEDTGPTCPHCGGRLVFEQFLRIRPPPLTGRLTTHRERLTPAPHSANFRR